MYTDEPESTTGYSSLTMVLIILGTVAGTSLFIGIMCLICRQVNFLPTLVVKACINVNHEVIEVKQHIHMSPERQPVSHKPIFLFSERFCIFFCIILIFDYFRVHICF